MAWVNTFYLDAWSLRASTLCQTNMEPEKACLKDTK